MKHRSEPGSSDSGGKIHTLFPSWLNEASFWKPRHIAESAWLEHGPFAFWLIDAVRPKTLVELGTHNGFSYFSFCQAVQQIGLSTACYAVDTWLGDEHAGFYGSEIYERVSRINDQEYSRFSRLLRCRFDDALPNFADSSVDMLHIDGRHGYNDVRIDFESWLPKLSSSAVVLFHDTNVRERDFGVWRLWRELVDRYPSFEFIHGHGLGVLAVGPDIPSGLRPLMNLPAEHVDSIRAAYASLGRAVSLQHQCDMVQHDLALLLSECREMKAERDRSTSEIGVAQEEIEAASKETRQLSADHQAALAIIARLKSENAALVALNNRDRVACESALAQNGQLRGELAAQAAATHTALARIQQLEQSAVWRASTPLRGVLDRMPPSVKLSLRRAAKTVWWAVTPHRMPERIAFLRDQRKLLPPSDAEDIAREIFAEQQSELSPEAAAQAISSFARRPLISVIMPVYKTPIQWLRRAVESLQEQYYPDWELCVVDDFSPTDAQRVLLQKLAAADPRIKLKVMEHNGGISAASNAGLRIAQGEYIALLDHDDELTPDALFRIAETINSQPDADFIYSDECKIDDTPARRLFDFIFKPDWSPEIMFNGMITGHLTVYSKKLVENAGGFRSDYDFSQDYDLALRASELAVNIVHVERLLYLWRSIPGSAAGGGKDFARESNIAALNDALRRRGIVGRASPLPHANYVRITERLEETRVSLVIPSDSHKNLEKVLSSIRGGTDYDNYEVVVVCNGPLADRLSDEFRDWEKARFVKYDKKYNFSDKCNEGARAANGDIVIFYNDDVFPIERDWVERLIEYLWVPGVGGVSPKLLYANDTIQYAGMISGTPGLCGTAYNNLPWNGDSGFLTMHKYVRNVSILSGACCALKKDVFFAVGGFDAINTPDGHSDMDLSYKLIEAGYRCVYTPYSLLHHIGNHSWGAKKTKYKADMFALSRWGKYVSKDPYFTDSMKRVLYHDFRFTYKIYADNSNARCESSGPDVLLVSHELTQTGAPRMLFYAALAIKQAGGFPVVVAPEDGPLRDELVRSGIVVIIDESIRYNHFLFERFARNFDLAIVNTIALSGVTKMLSAIDILETIWWLHEAQEIQNRWHETQGIHWERVRTLAVSNYARQFIPENIPAKVLYNGVPDESADEIALQSKLTFVLAGTIEPRKGQDILVDAIALLPEQVRRQCRFIIVGKLWQSHQSYWEAIRARLRRLPEVEYLGSLNHSETLKLLSSCDVLVCPSRDESFSLVAAEAAMLSKPCILSDHVGVHEAFDERSCFVFESGKTEALTARLLAAYESRVDLPEMGRAARAVFEQRLSLGSFNERFLAFVLERAGLDP